MTFSFKITTFDLVLIAFLIYILKFELLNASFVEYRLPLRTVIKEVRDDISWKQRLSVVFLLSFWV